MLQVHMGTHMWSSSQASRRGRRMSLELPHHAPPIPMTAKDSEFLQRRPELFFPYLPTQFNAQNGLPRPVRRTWNAVNYTYYWLPNIFQTSDSSDFPPTTSNGLLLERLGGGGGSCGGGGGQPVPPSLSSRHHHPLFPPLPAAHAAAAGGSDPERNISPEPLRVRSPESLQRTKAAAATEEKANKDENGRFRHEPWSWQLGAKNASSDKEKSDEENEKVDEDDEELIQTPQLKTHSATASTESLVA